MTVAFTNLLPFNGDFGFGKNLNSQGAKFGLYGGLTDLGDVMLFQKSLHDSCRMGRCIVVMKLICSLGHCELRRSHSTQAQSTASHCRLTSPTGECSRIHSKVSSDWLPSYVKAMRPVLEIFKMAGYIPDSPRIVEIGLTETTRSAWYLNFVRPYHKRAFGSSPAVDYSDIFPRCKYFLIMSVQVSQLLLPLHGNTFLRNVGV